MNYRILLTLLVSFTTVILQAQPCTPTGNETDFGINDQWIGYVYNSTNFTNYVGYVNEGSPGNPNFDQGFGGSNTTYYTSSCSINTSFFSVRYKLQKSFTAGAYDITVGGDDGFRLSLDGGSTWVINRWGDQSYTIETYTANLNGSYNIVLEYYESAGDNRISVAIQSSCSGTEDVNLYGTGNTWIGYVYDGTNFEAYKGAVTEPLNFIQNFGGDNTTFATSGCPVTTETFSVRYRLRRNYTFGSYAFVVGADDGYRLSFDGGATWAVNQWSDHGYQESIYITNLSGDVDMVLEYYENGGGNIIHFNVQNNYILPVTLLSFTGNTQAGQHRLNWRVTGNSNPKTFQLQQATHPNLFSTVATINASAGIAQNGNMDYQYTIPQSANAYYRLKITDQQGVVFYSNIIQLNAGQVASPALVFPTILYNQPLQVKLTTSYKAVTAQLYNTQGSILWQQPVGNITANNTISLPVHQTKLPAGTYILVLKTTTELITKSKIIISAY